jgi:hypothetical protein
MVVIDRQRVEREMRRRGLGVIELAGAMHVAENSVRSMLKGGPVGNKVQTALFQALGGSVPFGKLFVVVPDGQREMRIAQ